MPGVIRRRAPDQHNPQEGFRGQTAGYHVKPLSKGGAHMPCNIRPICKHCNRSKKDAWPYMKNVRASATV